MQTGRVKCFRRVYRRRKVRVIGPCYGEILLGDSQTVTAGPDTLTVIIHSHSFDLTEPNGDGWLQVEWLERQGERRLYIQHCRGRFVGNISMYALGASTRVIALKRYLLLHRSSLCVGMPLSRATIVEAWAGP